MASSYPPFDRYRDEFRNLVRQVEERLHEAKDASDLLAQCEEILPQLKLEARGAPDSSLKRELLDVYQACQMQFESYKTINNKKELFLTHDKSTSGSSHKDRMVSAKDQVANQNDQLDNALRSIRETEEIAGQINQELGRNRKTLENTTGNIDKLSVMTEQANGLLKSMTRKWF